MMWKRAGPYHRFFPLGKGASGKNEKGQGLVTSYIEWPQVYQSTQALQESGRVHVKGNMLAGVGSPPEAMRYPFGVMRQNAKWRRGEVTESDFLCSS